jgi:antitoxin component YwqK of YwqJK toxin-antitoxin module
MPITLNGYYVLYNKKGQITKEGTFKDNRLMEGKNYLYNATGMVQVIELYKDGYYVGDSPK